MSRYVARPRARGWVEDHTYDESPLLPGVSVDGPSSVDTGLITEGGDPIYRMQAPCGFGRDAEW